MAEPTKPTQPKAAPKTVTVNADDPRLQRPLDKVLVTDVEAYEKDRVAMVSRSKDGSPDQTANFEILPEVPDHERSKAENKTDENNDV